MGQIKRILWWTTGASALAVCGLCLLGCSSTPNDGGGSGAEYNLRVVLEKNLDSGYDIVDISFTRDDDGIPGGVVVVDGDTATTGSGSGQGNRTYTTPRWQHGEKIQIAAIDASESFVYRDSVVIPGDVSIENVTPANRIWRPVDNNALVSWTTSIGASNYVVSVKARTTNSTSRGLAEYSESQAGLTHVIPPTAFQDQFNNVIEDVYDLTVIAYSPNFIIPVASRPYKTPLSEDVPSPIQEDDIDGAIAAIVVADADTLVVQTE